MTLATDFGKFCDACQAIPVAGYCKLANCPNAPPITPERPADDFAARLRLAREGLEMSQEELSRRAKIAPAVISHYEARRRAPSLENLVRIIRAMPGLNANWLLGLITESASDEYQDGYFDAVRDAQEALVAVEHEANRRFFAKAEGREP